MLNHKLLKLEGILIVHPEAPLESADFRELADEIDSYIEANNELHGMMVDAPSFPGWKNFAALLAHLKFVKDHHREIRKIAIVNDSGFLTVAPAIASHFVQADLRHFPPSQKEDALRWLREQPSAG
ncbi:MAG TPA: STAS/SEC14 domain-containing protein [Pirellulales bacterium]|jgi:hypothetical protein|nr:STAS/SEC14 domain-containing protein [Pirellulales bacterium]